MTTGEKVLTIRQHIGLTQQQFADRINRTSGYISKVESNKLKLQDRLIQDICDAFKVKREFFSSDCSSSSPEEIFYEAEFFEPADPEIYKRVRMIRNDRKLTQEQFADLLGCSLQSVKSIENQRRNPSVSWLKNVAGKLNVSLEWLQNGRGDVRDTGTVAKEMERIIPYFWDNEIARKAVIRIIDKGEKKEAEDIWKSLTGEVDAAG